MIIKRIFQISHIKIKTHNNFAATLFLSWWHMLISSYHCSLQRRIVFMDNPSISLLQTEWKMHQTWPTKYVISHRNALFISCQNNFFSPSTKYKVNPGEYCMNARVYIRISKTEKIFNLCRDTLLAAFIRFSPNKWIIL